MAANRPGRQEIARQVLERITEIGKDSGVIEKAEARPDIFFKGGADLIIEITGRAVSCLLAVEARTSGEPRHAREALCSLAGHVRRLPHAYPVFAAPYISEKSAEICRENSTGFIDLAGNCRIALNGLFIRNRGNPNPYAGKRRLKSPARPKAARVIRVLLSNPRRHWKTRELAAEAGVSLGLVSNVRQILKDRELIDWKKAGLVTARPQELLELWAEESRLKEPVFFYRACSDFIQAENAISEMCRKKGIKCAFTGVSAAVHLAAGIEYYRQIQVRIQEDADLSEAGFEKCSRNEADTAAIHTTDTGAFYDMRRATPSSRLRYCRPSEKTVAQIEMEIRAPIYIVSPVQAWFDLVNTLQAGGNEAEKIRGQVIEPSW
ncbi:MAG: hypothetical protein ACLFNW_06800 [Desulfobacterales bacterium]